MNDAELAAREHENLIASLAIAAAEIAGAVVRRTDGVALVATGLALPTLNQVLVEGADARPAAISAAVDARRRRGDPFVVSLRSATDDRFVPLMADLGLVPMSEGPTMPGMALYPIPGQAPQALAGHAIRRVTDREGLEDHVRAAVAGFSMDEATIRAFMGPWLLDRPEAGVYVGYADGDPITAGLGFRMGRTIGIYNIATIEAARRQGHGGAMTERIAADGAAVGCEVAVLQATPMGLSTYLRLGYRTVVEYTWYAEPSGAPGDAPPA